MTLSPYSATWRNDVVAANSQMASDISAIHSDYDSKAAVEVDNISAARDSLRTAGYADAGDGGGALYKRVAVEPAHAGKIQSADGAWWELAEKVVNPRMFGAVADADPVAYTGTDDATAINNALVFINSLPTGGAVELLPGYYLANVQIEMLSKVEFVGRGGWIINAPGVSVHTISAAGQSNFKIHGLNIDQGGSGQVGGTHGIRCSGGCSDYEVTHNYVKNVRGYAITNQDSEGYTVAFNRIENNGADAIDCHNEALTEKVGLIVGNVIEGFAQSTTTKGAIHGRGSHLIVANNIVRGCGSGSASTPAGILCGNGEVNVAYAQKIIGNIVDPSAGPYASATTCSGITIDTPGASVENNTIYSLTGGVNCTATKAIVAGNNVIGSGTGPEKGIVIGPDDNGVNDGTLVVGNRVSGAAQDGVYVNGAGVSNATVQGNHIQDCGGYGVKIISGATGTLIQANRYKNNTSGQLADSGTGTINRDPTGDVAVGEYVESVVTGGGAVALTSGTSANVTSISLTAGDWDVDGTVVTNANVTSLQGAVNTVSATLPATGTAGSVRLIASLSGTNVLPTGTRRLSLSATTTVYLVVNAAFTGSVSAYGSIRARRSA